jgi:hypothetical protein
MNTTAPLLIDIQKHTFPGGEMTLEGIESAAGNAR